MQAEQLCVFEQHQSPCWKLLHGLTCLNPVVFFFYYAPNFEDVDGAYWFRVVRPSVRARVLAVNASYLSGVIVLENFGHFKIKQDI